MGRAVENYLLLLTPLIYFVFSSILNHSLCCFKIQRKNTVRKILLRFTLGFTLVVIVDMLYPFLDEEIIFNRIKPKYVGLVIACGYILCADDFILLYRHHWRNRSVSAFIRNFIFNTFESRDLQNGYDHLFQHLCDVNVKDEFDFRNSTKVESLRNSFANCSLCSKYVWIRNHFDTFAVMCCASAELHFLGKVHGNRNSNSASSKAGMALLEELFSDPNDRLCFLKSAICEDLKLSMSYENDTSRTTMETTMRDSALLWLSGTALPVFSVVGAGSYRVSTGSTSKEEETTVVRFDDTYDREYKIDPDKLRKFTNFEGWIINKLGTTEKSAFDFFTTYGTHMIVSQKSGERQEVRLTRTRADHSSRTRRQRSFGGGVAAGHAIFSAADSASQARSMSETSETYESCSSTTTGTLMSQSSHIVSLISDGIQRQRYLQMYESYMRPSIRIGLMDDKKVLWKLCFQNKFDSKKKRGTFGWREASTFSSDFDIDTLQLFDVRVESSGGNGHIRKFTGVLCVKPPEGKELLLSMCPSNKSVKPDLIEHITSDVAVTSRIRVEINENTLSSQVTLVDSNKFLAKKTHRAYQPFTAIVFNSRSSHQQLVAIDTFVLGRKFNNFPP
eukprot:m.157057 g.157057  ORF g.157057 m.157057 type:complete len:617 (-) comp17959_c0_seq3:623-2473(-)